MSPEEKQKPRKAQRTERAGTGVSGENFVVLQTECECNTLWQLSASCSPLRCLLNQIKVFGKKRERRKRNGTCGLSSVLPIPIAISGAL